MRPRVPDDGYLRGSTVIELVDDEVIITLQCESEEQAQILAAELAEGFELHTSLQLGRRQ